MKVWYTQLRMGPRRARSTAWTVAETASVMRNRWVHSGRPLNQVAVFSSPISLEKLRSSEDSFFDAGV